MTDKKLLILLLPLFLATSCRFFNKHSEQDAQTLILGFTEVRGSLDWQRELNLPATLTVTHIMEGLTDYTWVGDHTQMIPALAESWESKKDQTQWTFKLRSDAKWSDGKPLSASDFMMSFKRLLSPETKSPFTDIFSQVVNAQKYAEGKIKNFDEVGIKVIDGATLQFNLNETNSHFPELLAHFSVYPLRDELLEFITGQSKKKMDQIPWIGPYKLALFGKRKTELIENEKYWGKKGNLQKIDMFVDYKREKLVSLLFESRINIAFSIDSQPPLTKVVSFLAPNFEYYQLTMGSLQKPLKNPILRRVISLSINKEELARLVPYAQPLGDIIPPGVTGYESNRGMRFDPEMASLVLHNAHMEQDLAPYAYTLYVNFPKESLAFTIAENIRDQLKKSLNMNITVVQGHRPEEESNSEKASPFMILEKIQGKSLDPLSYLSRYDKGSLLNKSAWKNRDYDEFLKKSSLAKAQHLIVEEENPVVPLFSTYIEMLAQPRVDGLRQTFMRYIDFRDVILESH